MKGLFLDSLEPKSLVAEPINVFALSLGVPTGLIGTLNLANAAKAKAPAQAASVATVTTMIPATWQTAAAGGRASLPRAASASAAQPLVGDRVSPVQRAAAWGPTLSLAAAPASSTSYGTDALGLGKGHPAAGQAAAQGESGPSQTLANGGSGRSTAANLAGGGSQASASATAGALGSSLGLGQQTVATATPSLAASHSRAATTSSASLGATTMTLSTPLAFDTLDYNNGVVLYPGYYQLAKPGVSVDLRAQVTDAASGTYTYSWNTSGLTDATSISGASTSRLTFQWNSTFSTTRTDSVTLTVTDPNNVQVTKAYTFQAFPGTASSYTAPTWPTTLDPGLVTASSPTIAAGAVSVSPITGAAGTSISLPSSNPNVPGLTFLYSSTGANAMPIIVGNYALTAGGSKVSAQLSFSGLSAGSTYYYDTSSFRAGDIVQVSQQANATSLTTGRYSYTMTVSEVGGSTTSLTGHATVVNEATDPTFAAFGKGWTIAGLNKVVPAADHSGIIYETDGGTGLWYGGDSGIYPAPPGSFMVSPMFSPAPGAYQYTDPAGDFATMVENTDATYVRALTDGTVYYFNSAGLQTSVVDRNGLTTTYAYSGNLLTSITDPFGEVTTLNYTSGVLSSIVDPAGRTTYFTVSSSKLTGVTLPDSAAWSYGYDSSYRLTSLTEPSSTGEPTKTTGVVYDAAGRVGTVNRADSTSETFASAQEQGWTNSGTSASPAPGVLLAYATGSHTDANGNTTLYRHDWLGLGEVVQTIDPLTYVSTTDVDANGLPVTSIDPLNRVTQQTFDTKGNVTKVTYPDLTTTTYGTYNSFAEPASVTDQLSRTTSFTYDSNGNRTRVQDPLNLVTTYTYSSTQPGLLTAQTAPAPSGTSSYTLYSYTYDSKYRRLTSTDANSHTTTTTYDSAGRVASVTDPNGNQTTYSYDNMNRVTAQTQAVGTSSAGTTQYQYDAAGNKTVVTDPNSHSTTTKYDAMDRVSTVTDPMGGVTTYTYDSGGRLHTLTDSVNNTTTYAYDADDRQTVVTSPSVNSSSGVATSYVYDADGEVTSVTDPNGRQITYTYDSVGRLKSETWVGGSNTVTHNYDAAGQLTSLSDANSLITLTYDNDGRLQTSTESGSGLPQVTLTYGYDSAGDLKTVTDNLSGTGGAGQGITTYVYDNALRLTTITQSFGGTAQTQMALSYDSGNRLTTQTWSLGTKQAQSTYSYDNANRVTSIVDKLSSASGLTQVDQQGYTYDAAGRVVTHTYGASSSVTYSYNNDDEVTGSTGSLAESFNYDANGNRNTTGYTTGSGNQMTASPGTTYQYDNAGNTIRKTDTATGNYWTYTYDYRNRMTSAVQKSSGGTTLNSVTYVYDALDRRIAVTTDGGTTQYTVYSGSGTVANPYADYTGSTLKTRYLYGPAVDQLLARTDANAAVYWYMADKLGSITDDVSTSGTYPTVVDNITYSTFGTPTETSAANGDRFKFTGREYDGLVSLYFYRSRYYDSASGRFTSRDSIGFQGGDWNLFRYALNEVTRLTDPTGHEPGDTSGLQYGQLGSGSGLFGGPGSKPGPKSPSELVGEPWLPKDYFGPKRPLRIATPGTVISQPVLQDTGQRFFGPQSSEPPFEGEHGIEDGTPTMTGRFRFLDWLFELKVPLQKDPQKDGEIGVGKDF